MLKKIIFVLAVALAIFIIVAAMQPADFRVTRSSLMAASPAAIFAKVNDFHEWDAWSPWAKLDPNCKVTFAGPTAGPGAEFGWNGNSEVGEGKMTITESTPNESVKISLDFIRPFPSSCRVDFSFVPDGDKTKVTWNMAGQNNFFAKAFSLFMDCEKMVGGDFEKGLTSMKAAVEGTPK